MEEFKSPLMPPPVFVKPREAKTAEISSSSEQPQQESEQPLESPKVQAEVKPKPPNAKTPASHYGPGDQEKYQKILASLQYVAPSGSCTPTKSYSLEVLKDGSILENIKLEGKGYFIVGRVPGCDIVAEHPTISRMHAILQYIGEESEIPANGNDDSIREEKLVPGVYVYDLGSTHGTFVNKNQLFPKRYYRLHVGHVIKFGNSTRLYILSGPPEDEEEESDKTVSELVKEKNAKEMERRRLQMEGVVEEPLLKNVEDEGVSWGMPEDAVEESDNRENPFALDLESTELSLDNPKRTLRGWFEREGYDLDYDVKEKAAGHFICRINLPLDGPDQQKVFAEVELKGKKKDVVAQCALQACQILDKYGVLRQSNHESRLKRKQRDWADEDYYSSDDDNYLDRTGTIEKKREKRMKQAGLIKPETETYDSLLAKDKGFQKEIDDLELKIRKIEKKHQEDEGSVDPLDAFMMDLKTGVSDVKKLKSKLRELTDQQNKNRKLLKIAMPTIVFPVKKVEEAEQVSARDEAFESTSEYKLKSASAKSSLKGMSGPRIQFKSFNVPRPPTQGEVDTTVDTNTNDQLIRGEASPESEPIKSWDPPPPASEPVPRIKPLGPQAPPSPSKPIIPSEIEPSSLDEPTVADTENLDDETPEDSTTAPGPAKPKRTRYRKPKSNPEPEEYDMEDPDYVTWVPPTGQRGDGRTSLNEKLGY